MCPSGSPTPQKKGRRPPGLRNPGRAAYGPEVDERMLRAAGPLPPPVKSAKDPLKVKGQKSNIQLTLINKVILPRNVFGLGIIHVK